MKWVNQSAQARETCYFKTSYRAKCITVPQHEVADSRCFSRNPMADCFPATMFGLGRFTTSLVLCCLVHIVLVRADDEVHATDLLQQKYLLHQKLISDGTGGRCSDNLVPPKPMFSPIKLANETHLRCDVP